MTRILVLSAVTLVGGCSAPEKAPPYLERPEVLAACHQSRAEIRQPIRTDEIFIEAPYLKFLTGWQNERGHVQHPDLRAVVRYTLEKGLTALETDLRFGANSNFLWTGGSITRISVKPAQSPACRFYRYPWWEMPALRKLGLDPDHCVAVETFAEPTANVRVLARPTKSFRIATDREWFAHWRIDVEAGTVDAQREMQPSIRVVDHVAWFQGGGNWGYEGWAWGCHEQGARAREVNAAISGKGNPLLHRPEQVVVPAPEVPVEESELSANDMAQLRWLERGRCAGGGNTYDAAGTVWIEDIVVDRKLQTALHVLRGERLLVAPMPSQFPRRAYSNHSALHYKDGFAVNLTRLFKNDESRRLVVFDENLKHVATWKLSAAQMEALVPSEPATINRCTDTEQDQFQRISEVKAR